MNQQSQLSSGSESLAHVGHAVLLFIAALVAGWILKRFLGSVGRRWALRTKNELDDRILAAIVPRITWMAFVVGSFLASEEVANITTKNPTAGKVLGYTKGTIYVAFVFVITMAVIRLVDTVMDFAMKRYAKRMSATFDEALFLLLNRFSAVCLGAIAFVIVLGHFGVDVSSLLVFLGGGSVALALAAQDTLSNMIAGFVIMIDRPFRIGDRVKLPTGEIGDVYEIGMRSTKILDVDHNTIISPNAELVKTKLINYSYPERKIRVIVDIGVGYGTDLQRARALMLSLAQKQTAVLKDPAPEVLATAITDATITLQLVAHTEDFRNKGRIESVLREQIYEMFRKEKIEIPFPQRVVHVRESSNVRYQGSQKRKTLRR